MHCVVHMQLDSQGEVLPLSPTQKDGSSLLTIKPATVDCVSSVWGSKLFSPNPIDLALWLLKQPTAQFHAFLSECLCTVCPHDHG